MVDREYFNNRRKDRRAKFIDLLGGKCKRCGSKNNLQFDHQQPNKKEFRIADRIDAPEDILLNEVNKCILLCAPCHRDKTKENGEHGQPEARCGTLHQYKRYGCRCDKCKQRMSEYNKERKMLSSMDRLMKIKKLANEFKVKLSALVQTIDTEPDPTGIIMGPNEEHHKGYKDIMYGDKTDLERAAELIKMISELTMNNPMIKKGLGNVWTAIVDNEYPEAFDALRAVGKNLPDKAKDVLITLARVVAHLRNDDKARA